MNGKHGWAGLTSSRVRLTGRLTKKPQGRRASRLPPSVGASETPRGAGSLDAHPILYLGAQLGAETAHAPSTRVRRLARSRKHSALPLTLPIEHWPVPDTESRGRHPGARLWAPVTEGVE